MDEKQRWLEIVHVLTGLHACMYTCMHVMTCLSFPVDKNTFQPRFNLLSFIPAYTYVHTRTCTYLRAGITAETIDVLDMYVERCGISARAAIDKIVNSLDGGHSIYTAMYRDTHNY
jgi:hypothetical protein